MRTMKIYASLLIAVVAIMFAGCGQRAAETNHDHDGHDHGEQTVHVDAADHSGWWCNEHGIPEEVCTRCDASLVASFKEKGDWCYEHERPDSVCFHCHPQLQQKFAERYEARYGKQPPEITDP